MWDWSLHWCQGRVASTHGIERIFDEGVFGLDRLTAVVEELAAGELSPSHAAVLAAGTADLSATTAAAAEPVLLDMAGRLDPPGLRKLVAHLRDVADPDGAEARIQRQHGRRGLWLSPTLAGMVAIDGLLEPEAGDTLLTALEPLARPASAELHGRPDRPREPGAAVPGPSSRRARRRPAAAPATPTTDRGVSRERGA
jgi:hypothetical protein